MVRTKNPRTAPPAEKKIVSVTSINMQKSRICWDYYKKVLAEAKNPVVMAVQEVPKNLACSALTVIRHNDKSRVSLLASKTLRVIPMPQFCSNDLAVGQWSNIGPKGRRTTIVASAYWPHEEKELPKSWGKLFEYANQENCNIIFMGDMNAHSILWGSEATNKRGEETEDLVFEKNLEVLNQGSTPTWRTGAAAASST